MDRTVTVTRPDTQSLIEWVDELRKKYPEITPTVYGRTRAGRPIFLLSVGTGKEKIFYSAGYHGSEWITVLTAMRFLEDILLSLKTGEPLWGYDFKKILKEKRLVFIPCVNPDGTEIAINGFHCAREYYQIVKSVGKGDHLHWNANAAGIDINHNFDAGWEKLKEMEIMQGIRTPAPTRFGGLAPESEPETRAVTTLCRQVEFSRAMALHSQGEELSENEYYIADIIGMEVVTEEGEPVGQVKDVLETGANDVYLVKREGKKDLMLPDIRDCIREVDIENNRMTVHILDGLADL